MSKMYDWLINAKRLLHMRPLIFHLLLGNLHFKRIYKGNVYAIKINKFKYFFLYYFFFGELFEDKKFKKLYLNNKFSFYNSR